jgi:hypothetical protein
VASRTGRAAMATEVEAPDAVAAGNQVLDQGPVASAVLTVPVEEDDGRSRPPIRQPGTPGELRSADALQCALSL